MDCAAITSMPQPIPLTRSHAAVALEGHLKGMPELGPCHNGVSLLDEIVSDKHCSNIFCMYSSKCNMSYDFGEEVFRPMPAAGRSRCHIPSGGQIRQPGVRVEVSFILSIHNHVTLATQCLLELYRTAAETTSAEFFVVDDGSTEDTSVLIDTVRRLITLFDAPIKLIRHVTPRGFGGTNMAGARQASGQYIALINSDMFVSRGWLAVTLATFAQQPRAGLVGPLFIGKGMLVTEGGGVPVLHNVSFMRPVDYVSAALVVIKRQAFLLVGGLDARYGRGYYEDTDLAMSLHLHGYQVLFQPLSVAYHQEGTTLGVGVEKQALMDNNRQLFHRKWSSELQAKHCPRHVPAGVAYRARRGPRILWLDDLVPETDRDAASLRTFEVLKILLDAGYDLTYQPSEARAIPYKLQAQFYGVDVLPAWSTAAWRESTQGRCQYDAIVIARRYIYEALGQEVLGTCSRIPFIYDTVDIHFLRETRISLSQAPDFTHESLRVSNIIRHLDSLPRDHQLRHNQQVELNIFKRATVALVVSREDAELITNYVPSARTFVVPNINEPVPAAPQCIGRTGVLFVGSFAYLPNRQAVQYLLTEVLPHILKLLPKEHVAGFKIHLVGAPGAPSDLLTLVRKLTQHVTHHSWLSESDLKTLYGQVKVATAPLLSGTGVKGKISQAMKYGVPVVATSVAIEGMHMLHGVDTLVGDNAVTFADRLVQLYTNCQLWDALAGGGLANIRLNFSPEKARTQLLLALSEAGVPPRGVNDKHCP
ncbi:MAG: hypothetical protein WDW36_004673 [Sanguina aurantia]